MHMQPTKLLVISLTQSSWCCLKTQITFRLHKAIIHTMPKAMEPETSHNRTSQMSKIMDWCKKDFKHRSTHPSRSLMMKWSLRRWLCKLNMRQKARDSFMRLGPPNRNTDKETGFSQWDQLILRRSQKHRPNNGKGTMSQRVCLEWDLQPFHSVALTSTGLPLQVPKALNSNSMLKLSPMNWWDSRIDSAPPNRKPISILTLKIWGALMPSCSVNRTPQFRDN